MWSVEFVDRAAASIYSTDISPLHVPLHAVSCQPGHPRDAAGDAAGYDVWRRARRRALIHLILLDSKTNSDAITQMAHDTRV